MSFLNYEQFRRFGHLSWYKSHVIVMHQQWFPSLPLHLDKDPHKWQGLFLFRFSIYYLLLIFFSFIEAKFKCRIFFPNLSVISWIITIVLTLSCMYSTEFSVRFLKVYRWLVPKVRRTAIFEPLYTSVFMDKSDNRVLPLLWRIFLRFNRLPPTKVISIFLLHLHLNLSENYSKLNSRITHFLNWSKQPFNIFIDFSRVFHLVMRSHQLPSQNETGTGII